MALHSSLSLYLKLGSRKTTLSELLSPRSQPSQHSRQFRSIRLLHRLSLLPRPLQVRSSQLSIMLMSATRITTMIRLRSKMRPSRWHDTSLIGLLVPPALVTGTHSMICSVRRRLSAKLSCSANSYLSVSANLQSRGASGLI